MRSELTTSKANVEQLVQERTAWDPEYLAQLKSVNLPPSCQSSAVSKALTISSASGPATPTVNRPVPASSVNDTSSKDASSTAPRPASGFSSFASSFGPPDDSNKVPANPATDVHSDPIQDFFGNGFDDYYGDSGHDDDDFQNSNGNDNAFNDYYGGFGQDDDYFQNGNGNGNDDSGIGPDELLSGEASINTPGNSVIATPAFGAPLQQRTWDPKYLAASANAADFVLPMPSGLNRDNNRRIIRDWTRSDQLFDYRLSERRSLYLYGWNPDTLNKNVFPPHSDEAHLMEAVAAARDDVLVTIDRYKGLVNYGDNGDCCPQGLTGLHRNKSITYRCPDPRCRTSRSRWIYPYYRLAAMCRLERSEYWKIDLPMSPSTTSEATAFHASAECCVFQGANYCVLHVHMETASYNNKVRTTHHNGRQSCHCPVPCIGKCVTHLWTEQDYQLLDAMSGLKPAPGPKPLPGPNPLPGPKPLSDTVCRLDGCDVPFTPTDERPDYCFNHARPCKNNGCNGRCGHTYAHCTECLKTRTICQFDGCTIKTSQAIYCSAHFKACGTDGCNGRCATRFAVCAECKAVRTVCQAPGCKTKGYGKSPYCAAHPHPCKIPGCEQRARYDRCAKCIEKGMKRKKDNNVVGADDGEERDEDEESPRSPKRTRT